MREYQLPALHYGGGKRSLHESINFQGPQIKSKLPLSHHLNWPLSASTKMVLGSKDGAFCSVFVGSINWQIEPCGHKRNSDSPVHQAGRVAVPWSDGPLAIFRQQMSAHLRSPFNSPKALTAVLFAATCGWERTRSWGDCAARCSTFCYRLCSLFAGPCPCDRRVVPPCTREIGVNSPF
jgi:hypothetical protein